MAFNMNAVAQPTFPLYDRLLNGKLTQLLADWQAEGLSATAMAFELRDRDCVVSPETVRRWLHQLEAAR